MAAVKNICTYVQVIRCTINFDKRSVPLSLKYMFLTFVLDFVSGLFLLGLGYCFGFLKSKLRKADLLSVTEKKEGRFIVCIRPDATNFEHLSPRISQRATQQICASEATCRLQENPLPLNSFSSVVLQDTANRSKHRRSFYDLERITTRRKCVSLVMFLIRHVLSFESACSQGSRCRLV